MAIQEHEARTPVEHQDTAETPVPVEAISLPDGSVQPAHPLVLRGLAESIKHEGMPQRQAAEMYKTWDPALPEPAIYKHLNT